MNQLQGGWTYPFESMMVLIHSGCSRSCYAVEAVLSLSFLSRMKEESLKNCKLQVRRESAASNCDGKKKVSIPTLKLLTKSRIFDRYDFHSVSTKVTLLNQPAGDPMVKRREFWQKFI